ncbi:glycosyltransferase [Corynebacterium phocae]|uniref:Glycosyltransferase n=1 Tax=Corynebacterium phocae TaxID=161895 RepID=A0A1L7D5S8_9CORY|nr:hypothetical protein [Corynebacterium phocae]APT93470.1 glycosyltransferase [Corynebacterium phocae]KAA8721031.1 hypothetical protein F4V58_11310 [Corynebacterium phocae]
MTVTIVGIVSITLGFICVMSAYYSFQKAGESGSRRPALVLGLLGFLFLTIIPASTAVFFAATHGM